MTTLLSFSSSTQSKKILHTKIQPTFQGSPSSSQHHLPITSADQLSLSETNLLLNQVKPHTNRVKTFLKAEPGTNERNEQIQQIVKDKDTLSSEEQLFFLSHFLSKGEESHFQALLPIATKTHIPDLIRIAVIKQNGPALKQLTNMAIKTKASIPFDTLEWVAASQDKELLKKLLTVANPSVEKSQKIELKALAATNTKDRVTEAFTDIHDVGDFLLAGLYVAEKVVTRLPKIRSIDKVVSVKIDSMASQLKSNDDQQPIGKWKLRVLRGIKHGHLSLDSRNNYRSFLVAAAKSPYSDPVTLLASAGINVNQQFKSADPYHPDEYGTDNTILHQLADYSSPYSEAETLKKAAILLQMGADVTLTNIHKETPLTAIASKYNVEPGILSLLLKAGSNVDHQNNQGDTALIKTLKQGNKASCVPILLQAGANVNLPNEKRDTALVIAAADKNNASQTLPLLIQKGAEVNHENNAGTTALLHVITNHDIKSTRILLDAGAQIHHRDLYAAVETGNPSLVKMLIDQMDKPSAQSMINRPDTKGRTSFTEAARQGHTEVAKLLLEHGADIEHYDQKKNTALLARLADETLLAPWSTEYSEAKEARLKRDQQIREMTSHLISKNVNVNHQNSEGYSALHYAAQKGYLELSTMLLKAGADPTLEDASGWKGKPGHTPLTLAKYYKDKNPKIYPPENYQKIIEVIPKFRTKQ